MHGYDLKQAGDGEEALAAAKEHLPDLILLDIMMPKIDGIEVCRRLKNDASLPFMPIILVTAKADSKDVVTGLEAGADEYLTKPIDQMALVARVKSVLRLKELHDQVHDLNSQPRAARRRPARRDRAHVPAAPLPGAADRRADPRRRAREAARKPPPRRHRVFCDLRGFTAFSETAEPEEVMAVLREYHAGSAPSSTHEGTLERFAGDGLMVLFNDPLPVPGSGVAAVKMALEMRARLRS